ncbi:hypothetical protein [Mycolicibacterium sp.]|uniref:hypothetical protein n=1 Tax=Mycolicibacterium sp. TaxID=2320850 RepID=UPI00355CBC50
MRKTLQRAAITAVAAFAPLAFTAVVAPAVGSAVPVVPNCENGWWDPVANMCRPPVATTPLACDNGWWWDPVANVCREPLLPPQ